MDYFLEFHWWYILVGFFLLILFNKGKGGVVVKRFTANMKILDQRFIECLPEATYSVFKKGKPEKIDIEIENLFLQTGEELEFLINGKVLSHVKVKSNKEAEFEHWSDEGVDFPKIHEGDELVIKYQGIDVLKGTFH